MHFKPFKLPCNTKQLGKVPNKTLIVSKHLLCSAQSIVTEYQSLSRPAREKARQYSAAQFWPFCTVTLLMSASYYAYEIAFNFNKNVN